ncbi:MAG TPA: hypothetical protein VFL17_09290 [Anaerolineae bacterium]|nr:hypothetical protein [Anaerolineae bacterium]
MDFRHRTFQWGRAARRVIPAVFAFALGLSSGYALWGRATLASGVAVPSTPKAAVVDATPAPAPANRIDLAALSQQVNPPGGYTLPAKFGDIGPKLLAAGGIDFDRFVQLYEQGGQPLTDEQIAILKESSAASIVIDRENASFLLNVFWAVGLTNRNRILTEGPMMQGGKDQVGNFASTAGWTMGARPPAELYASASLITLTSEQQLRLEEVAQSVYRPCCNNPTHFPDCNHGMAMLGLLELMASQGASSDEMFEAAKFINAFWYPQQTLEQAIYFEAAEGLDFSQVEPRTIVGVNYSSASGYRAVRQWLASSGLLKQSSGGGSCSVSP